VPCAVGAALGHLPQPVLAGGQPAHFHFLAWTGLATLCGIHLDAACAATSLKRRHQWRAALSEQVLIGAGLAGKGVTDMTSIIRSAAIRIDDSAFDLSGRTFLLEVGEARRIVQSDCDEGGDHGFLADVRWDPAAL
jgi:hypothetical protein